LQKPKDMKVLKVFKEAMQRDEGGEVVLRCGDETGRVFFAGGKVAWATVSTIKKTLTEYLLEHSSLNEEEVKEAFEESKRLGKNLGETVVEWDLLGETTVRRLLLQHISKCLLKIFSWSAVEAMFVPENKNYKGSLTFDFQEVLDAAMRLDTDGRLPFSGCSAEEILAELEKDPEDKPKLVIVSESGEEKILSKEILTELGKQPHREQEPIDETALVEEPPEYGDGEQALPIKKGKGGKLLALFAIFLVLAAGALFYHFRDRLFPQKSELPEPTVPDTRSFETNNQPMAIPQETKIASPEEAMPDEEEKLPEKKPEEPEEDEVLEVPAGIVAGAKGEGTGTIHIVSKPRKALIYLDGVYTGQRTPFTLRGVPAGLEHVVMLEKKGRLPAFMKLKLDKGQNASMKLYLKRKGRHWRWRALVHVDSEPQGADVYLDGKRTKNTTPTDIKLQMSRATKLDIRHRDYRSWIRIVRPIPDLNLTIFAKLESK